MLNINEWKKIRIDEIESACKILEPFNPIILPRKKDDMFEGMIYLSVSPETFPFDHATDIAAQLEGTGETGRYELRFHFWQSPIRVCQTFNIDTDEQNTAMLALLKNTQPTTRSKIINALQHELAETIKWIRKDTDPTYANWRLQEPKLKGKIDRVQIIIKELSEGIASP